MNLLEHSPALIVAIPLLTGFLTPLVSKINKKLRNFIILISLLLTLILVWNFAFSYIFPREEPFVYVFGANSPGITLPSGYKIPVRIIFEIDSIGAFMSLITSIIAFLSFIYSLEFMKKYRGLEKYYTLFLLLTAGIFGMEFTGDLFNFFVFLEITSIAACALIGFHVNKSSCVNAGFKTMVMYTVAALFFLLAVGLLYGQYDALNIGILATKINGSLLDKLALGLFITALALKIGSVPMHFWVPEAYGESPSPVSMILVTNTQASLYALFRICFTLYGIVMNTALIGWIIIILGILSMFFGATLALIQRSIKRLIAYIAISQIGYMLLGVGVGLTTLENPQLLQNYGITAMRGGIFHIFNDAICIGVLFLISGAIIYRTKIYDMNNLGGLARNMKYTAIFFIISSMAISGLPPFNGFVSKLLIYESVYKLNPLLSIIAILISIVTLANFVIVFHGVFLGPKLKKFDNINDAPKEIILPIILMIILIVISGMFPDLFLRNLVEPAVKSLINKEIYISAIGI